MEETKKISEEELNEMLLRDLCNECYELGEQQNHRMYNPKLFNRILEKLNK